MKAYWKYLIIGVAIVVSAWLLARAYTYKYHAQETIVVTVSYTHLTLPTILLV